MIDITPQQLRRAADIQERIDQLRKELNALLGGRAQTAGARASAGPTMKRRPMSPAARQRLAEIARSRWAKAKASGRSRL